LATMARSPALSARWEPRPDRSAYPPASPRPAAHRYTSPPTHPATRHPAGDGPPVHRSRTGPDCPGVLSRADRVSRHPAGPRPASALAGRLAAPSPGSAAGVPPAPASYPATRPSLRTPHASPAVGPGVGSRAFAAPVSRLRRVSNRGTGPLAHDRTLRSWLSATPCGQALGYPSACRVPLEAPVRCRRPAGVDHPHAGQHAAHNPGAGPGDDGGLPTPSWTTTPYWGTTA